LQRCTDYLIAESSNGPTRIASSSVEEKPVDGDSHKSGGGFWGKISSKVKKEHSKKGHGGHGHHEEHAEEEGEGEEEEEGEEEGGEEEEEEEEEE
jgi:hypothetical protein